MDNIISVLKHFNNQRDWGKFHLIKNLSMALSIEASELMELFQWETESSIKEKISKQAGYLESINMEISDVFIYLLIICDKLGLDEQMIKDNIYNKIRINGNKYPIMNRVS